MANNWVVQMQDVVNAMAADEPAAPPSPSIYRVPPWIKGTRSDAYEPQVVSLGPFHHGLPNLLPMEEYKRHAMASLVHRSRKTVQAFVNATATDAVVNRLQAAYDGLDVSRWGPEGRNDRAMFVQMMATDGCFLLEMVLRIHDAAPGPSGTVVRAPGFDGHPNDIHEILYIWESIRKDVAAIENQLPLFLLKKLELVRHPGAHVTDEWINTLVRLFFLPPEGTGVPRVLALHPLEILHKCFCESTSSPSSTTNHGFRDTMPPAVELSQAGIAFKKSETRKLHDIKFSKGFNPVLHIPVFKVRYDTERYLLNLVAFEELHASAGNVITSYLCFMDNIINTEADVALLRSAGVLDHTLGDDKAVADLFNTVYTGPLSPYSDLHKVQGEVIAHCKKKYNYAKWWADFVQTYASDPLVLTSFLAAVILLLLTALQTVYAIVSYHHSKSS